jgi:hypothetical protein
MLDTLYYTPAGEARVTCGAHRRDGLALTRPPGGGTSRWTCRGCGLAADLHESTDETLARRQAEEAQA